MRWTEGNESVFKNQFLFPAFRMEFNSIWNRICSCLLSYWILVSIGLWLTHMSLALVWLLRIWLFIICKVIDIIFIVISEIKEASQVGLSGRNYMKNAILQRAVGIFALTNEWERGWQTHTVKRVWKRLRVVRVCLPLHKHTRTPIPTHSCTQTNAKVWGIRHCVGHAQTGGVKILRWGGPQSELWNVDKTFYCTHTDTHKLTHKSWTAGGTTTAIATLLNVTTWPK